jgi:hypothetical protein
MGRRVFRRMWYAAAALVSLPCIGLGYAAAYGSLFGTEVELFLPAPGTVSTAIRTEDDAEPREVSTAASRLFYEDGKGPRADRFAVSASKPARPSVMASIAKLPALPGFFTEKDDDEGGAVIPVASVPPTDQDIGSAVLPTAGYAALFDANYEVDGFRPDPYDIAYRPSEEALKFRYKGETQAEFEERERHCLATAIYFEARGEPLKGQIAVSQVILNRVRSPKFPQTICGVVYQGQYRKGCQFSFTCDGQSDTPRDKALWARAQELSKSFMAGEHWLPEVGYSTFYHADYVRPRWSYRMNKIDKIGRHIFYKKRGEQPYLVEASLSEESGAEGESETANELPTTSLAWAVQAVTGSVDAVTGTSATAPTQVMSLGYEASE